MKPIVGSIVALITPMTEDGSVDYAGLRRLIDWHIAQGTDCIGVVGTTGESPTVTVDEHCEIIRVCVGHARGRIPIMAGTGGNSTAEAIELSRYALKVGADCTLSVVPYYNKPSQEGIYQHFKAIAEEVDLPIVLYNIPGRCGAGMTPETIARLAEIENIVAIKEATGSLDQASEIAMRCDLTIISGDDSLTLPLASVGAKGVISVVANIVPADVKAMTDLILEGDLVSARQWHRKLFALAKNMLTLATNPIPIKAAMAMLDLASDELRLPMTPLEESKKAVLKKALADYGLLS